MHNLAIALHQKGACVTGSDDEILNPSRQRLASYGLLPAETGWDAGRVHQGLDAVIVGMHARADNPELKKARELGLPVYSFPEFLFRHAREKTRIVIGGSHGKTTITAMVLHVLKHWGIDADYMVGAQLEGFEVMVSLSENAPFMVLEGDEYPSSPADPRPKFLLYTPHIALLSGIAWDHVNVFSTFGEYVEQFKKFIRCIEKGGKLIFCQEDKLLTRLCEQEADLSLCLYGYGLPEFSLSNGITHVKGPGGWVPLRIFGRHNLLNLQGAMLVCQQLGVDKQMFLEAIRHFGGASNRMDILYSGRTNTLIRDFAHAPSKLRATLQAVREHYPGKRIIACMELHTYSSLNKGFLPQYAGTMDAADLAIVFFSPHTLELKQLPPLGTTEVVAAFNKKGLRVFTDREALQTILQRIPAGNNCFLLMSSGNFGGLDIQALVRSLEAGETNQTS